MVHLKLLTLLGVFITAGLASWSTELLQFRNSNCLSEANSATVKYSYVSVCIFHLNEISCMPSFGGFFQFCITKVIFFHQISRRLFFHKITCQIMVF